MESKELRNFYEEHVAIPFHTFQAYFLSSLKEPELIADKFTFFQRRCLKNLPQGVEPEQIIHEYFEKYPQVSQENKIKELFAFVRILERLKILLEELEQMAIQNYEEEGSGNLEYLLHRVIDEEKEKEMKELLSFFVLRLVFRSKDSFPTHSIQIIRQNLRESLLNRQFFKTEEILQQLAFTEYTFDVIEKSFDFLSPSFLQTLERLQYEIALRYQNEFFQNYLISSPFKLQLLDPKSPRDAAKVLKQKIIRRYMNQVDELGKWITFHETAAWFNNAKKRLLLAESSQEEGYSSPHEFFRDLVHLLDIVNKKFQGIHKEKIYQILSNVKLFGFHLVSISFIVDARLIDDPDEFSKFIHTIEELQRENGRSSVERIFIRNPNHPSLIIDYFQKTKHLSLEFIPYFSQLEQIRKSPQFFKSLFDNSIYYNHLKTLNFEQGIGFDFCYTASDIGVLPAFWEILKAREKVKEISHHQGIRLRLIEGISTEQVDLHDLRIYYRSISESIPLSNLDVVFSEKGLQEHFINPEKAHPLIHDLFAIGMEQSLFQETFGRLSSEDRDFLEEISETTRQVYTSLKKEELFQSYFHKHSPVQLAFFGIGTAIQRLIDRGNLSDLQAFVKRCSYFGFLLNLIWRSLEDPFFIMTRHLSKDEIWKRIEDELALCRKNLSKIGFQTEKGTHSMQKYQKSLHELFCFPGYVLHKYALSKIEKNHPLYKKMVDKTGPLFHLY